jgi:sialate O-acetylesterase
MVVQRGVAFPINGEATPETEIAVSFLGKTYRTRADSDGHWFLLLDSQVPGGPHVIELSVDSTEKTVIHDIYVGDLWLCSGQSNMEMQMERLKDNYPEEWDLREFPPIRQFTVPQEWDFSGPRQDVCGGLWTVATCETLHLFSATAWFFARSLFEKHRIPIGLVATAWGGTPIESWMSREALTEFPAKIALGEQYADTVMRDKIIRANESAEKAWEDSLAAGDSGMAEKWYKPDTDTASWDSIRLPGDFAESVPDGFCGVIWLHREFSVKGDFATQKAQVWLGTITDADTVYVNGVQVGTTGYRYPPRKYPLPEGTLIEGNNHIVIRVSCWNGEGGVIPDKAFRIFSVQSAVELAGIWQYRIGMRSSPRPEPFFFQRQPMGPFNAMIAPLLKYPLRGIIWYQGESNENNPGEYAALFRSLILDWRKRNSEKALPFLFVQLPVFGKPDENTGNDSWALIREAQCSALSLPVTGMAAGLDAGEWNDLHPLNKKDIGNRLALAAEKAVFAEKNTAPGPLLRSGERQQNQLVLRFDNCGEGLVSREQPYVSIIADGGVFRLPAEIEGTDSLSLDIAALTNPVAVLYAWAHNPRDRQLYNREGLPVIPFRFTL